MSIFEEYGAICLFLTNMEPLILAVLSTNSADDKFMVFSSFSQKIRFDTACRLSPKETICMNCQILFSGKNKKNISKCCLLNFFSQLAKH